MLTRHLTDLVIARHGPIKTVSVGVAMNPIVSQQPIVLLDRMTVSKTRRTREVYLHWLTQRGQCSVVVRLLCDLGYKFRVDNGA